LSPRNSGIWSTTSAPWPRSNHPPTRSRPARPDQEANKALVGVIVESCRGRRSCDSDQTLADSLQEILGLSTRLLHHRRIAAMFEFHFMKYKLGSNLGCVAALDEHPGTHGERGGSVQFCFLFRRKKTGSRLALVLAELRRGQAVVSPLSLFSAKQRGDREFPSTVGAGPALGIASDPDQRALHIGNPKQCYRNENRYDRAQPPLGCGMKEDARRCRQRPDLFGGNCFRHVCPHQPGPMSERGILRQQPTTELLSLTMKPVSHETCFTLTRTGIWGTMSRISWGQKKEIPD